MNLDELLDILNEYEVGPSLGMGPDTSGVRGKGSPVNFQTVQRSKGSGEDDDQGFPYDAPMAFGQPVGPRGIDRGTRPGSDVSGKPPTPSPQYGATWGQDDEVDEAVGDEYDFTQDNEWFGAAMAQDANRGQLRPGRPAGRLKLPVRSVTTPTGQSFFDTDNTDIVKMMGAGLDDGDQVEEAMGTPTNFGMSSRSGNMMGHVNPGGGGSNSWSHGDTHPEDQDEGFDPLPIPAESVENDGTDALADGTDDQLEPDDTDPMQAAPELPDDEKLPADMGVMGGDQELPDDEHAEASDFEDIASSLTVVPGGGWVMSPTQAGSARGLFGMMPEDEGDEIVSKAGAWDVLSRVVQAMDGNLQDMAEGDLLQFPGNPNPAQDLGQDASVTNMSGEKRVYPSTEADIRVVKKQLIKQALQSAPESGVPGNIKTYTLIRMTQDFTSPATGASLNKGDLALGMWEYNGVKVWSVGEGRIITVPHEATEEVDPE